MLETQADDKMSAVCSGGCENVKMVAYVHVKPQFFEQILRVLTSLNV